MPSITPTDWMQSPSARRVWQALEAAGSEARFVGGCVRDALLGRPVSDFDIASTLPPEDALRALEKADIKAIPTGLTHGTVTAVADDVTYEITTLREDVACDGRHADVAFTHDWQADASRRDFTMNALYATPEGEIFDYYSGVEDAKAGHVRFIGDAKARIEEDALRILRFFRFYARYGQGEMDETALSACVAEAFRLEGLSGERIQAEMLKLLAAPDPTPVLERMGEGGILRLLSLPVPPGEYSPLQRLVQQKPTPDAIARLAVLVRRCENPVEVRAALSQRWRLSNADKNALSQLVTSNVTAIAQWPEAEWQKTIRRIGVPRFCQMVRIAWAEDASADAKAYHAALKLADTWQVPEFPLKGGELIAAGIADKGPKVGTLLKALEEWWESHGYQPDKTALLSEARERVKADQLPILPPS